MSKIKQEKLKYEVDFIDAYIEEFTPKNVNYYWGFECPRVSEVGRYLSELYHQGKLKRWTTPLIWIKEGMVLSV